MRHLRHDSTLADTGESTPPGPVVTDASRAHARTHASRSNALWGLFTLASPRAEYVRARRALLSIEDRVAVRVLRRKRRYSTRERENETDIATIVNTSEIPRGLCSSLEMARSDAALWGLGTRREERESLLYISSAYIYIFFLV